jgi:nicotinate-nucleotide adenylyltransferase
MSIRRLGVLGGTFDPIHYGHLDAGDAAQRALGLDEVRLIPLHDPPHRTSDPRASAFHRFALVALAIQGKRSWRVSDAELRRQGESYTFDTLRALQGEGFRPTQIVFILGADAFAEIATWYRFPEVLDEAHFAVVSRPGTQLGRALDQVPGLASRVGSPGTWTDRDGRTTIFPVPAVTRDVSSSQLRVRLAEKLPIADLVPPSVAEHIMAHGLYGAVDDLHGEEQRTHT